MFFNEHMNFNPPMILLRPQNPPQIHLKVARKVRRQFNNKSLRRNHRIKQPGYDIQRRYN